MNKLFGRKLRMLQLATIFVVVVTALGVTFYSKQDTSKTSKVGISGNKQITTPVPSAVITTTDKVVKTNPFNPADHSSQVTPPPTVQPKSTVQSNKFVSIVSPRRGATYKYGELIPLTIKVADESKLSKIDLAWGKQGSLAVMKTLQNSPYEHSFRITEYSPYLIDGNKLTIGVYAYDKSGNYFAADITEVTMVSGDYSVRFKKPTEGETIRGTNTLSLEAEVIGDREIERVEFYAGSGALIQTFTAKPYAFDYDISHITCCFTTTYTLPLTVRAYDKSGNNVSHSITVHIAK